MKEIKIKQLAKIMANEHGCHSVKQKQVVSQKIIRHIIKLSQDVDLKG